jgi:hypothetical protein
MIKKIIEINLWMLLLGLLGSCEQKKKPQNANIEQLRKLVQNLPRDIA